MVGGGGHLELEFLHSLAFLFKYESIYGPHQGDLASDNGESSTPVH